jgi:hypothetical protein
LSNVGYWATHKYHRLNVKEYSEEWVGYDSMSKLVDILEGKRERAFLSTLFLTGGRVTEVLSLGKNNFEVRKNEGLIIVRGMKLLKRYRKVEEKRDSTGTKWITERLDEARKPFPILLNEPMVPIMLAWLEASKGELLFPSPYKKEENRPLSRAWAYGLIRNLDKMIDPGLRAKLGLDRPFIVKGEKIRDRIHLWLHWVRSQRACCLVSEYGFRLEDLIDWFTWEHIDTAMNYAKKGWRGLAEKMLVKAPH